MKVAQFRSCRRPCCRPESRPLRAPRGAASTLPPGDLRVERKVRAACGAPSLPGSPGTRDRTRAPSPRRRSARSASLARRRPGAVDARRLSWTGCSSSPSRTGRPRSPGPRLGDRQLAGGKRLPQRLRHGPCASRWSRMSRPFVTEKPSSGLHCRRLRPTVGGNGQEGDHEAFASPPRPGRGLPAASGRKAKLSASRGKVDPSPSFRSPGMTRGACSSGHSRPERASARAGEGRVNGAGPEARPFPTFCAAGNGTGGMPSPAFDRTRNARLPGLSPRHSEFLDFGHPSTGASNRSIYD